MGLKQHVQLALLDLSKAFDSLNHEVLFGKLQTLGFDTHSRSLITDFLTDRIQRVKCNDTLSDWVYLYKGVPQGTVLGPMLFTLYINDMAGILTDECKIVQFADDTCIFVTGENQCNVTSLLSENIDRLADYFSRHQLTLNINKTEYMTIRPKRSTESSTVSNPMASMPSSTNSVTYLGVQLDHNLLFDHHVSKILRNMAVGIKSILSVRDYVPLQIRLQLMNSFVLSHLQYSAVLLNGLTDGQLQRIDRQVNWAIKCCFFAKKFDHVSLLRRRTSTLTAALQIQYCSLIKLWDILNKQCKPFLSMDFPNLNFKMNHRTQQVILHKPGRTYLACKSFLTCSVHYWNRLPVSLRQINSRHKFKNCLAAHYNYLLTSIPCDRITTGWNNFKIYSS